MSNSENKSLSKVEKQLVELDSNALLFTTHGKRIYNLIVKKQTASAIHASVYFEYLHRKFECELILESNQITLIALSPSLLTPAGLFEVKANALTGENYLNHFGIITQKGDEAIGWLILDIINHFNACRLKPRNANLVRAQLN